MSTPASLLSPSKDGTFIPSLQNCVEEAKTLRYGTDKQPAKPVSLPNRVSQNTVASHSNSQYMLSGDIVQDIQTMLKKRKRDLSTEEKMKIAELLGLSASLDSSPSSNFHDSVSNVNFFL